jgi:GNAT superfamily N-acetyltransferase
MKTSIRTVLADDAPALSALTAELGYESSVGAMASRMALVAATQGHKVFVAEVDGVPAGWIHVFLRPNLESDLTAEIGGLVVAERRRRSGVGRTLVEAASAWASDQGAATLTVRCNQARHAGNLFYNSIGFTTGKTQTVWRRPVAPGPT